MTKFSNLNIILRRLVVVLISLIVLFISVYTIIPRTFLNSLAYKIADSLSLLIPPGEPGQNVNITFDNSNLFFQFSFLAIGFTISLSIILFFWNKVIDKWKIKLVTILLMIVLMVISTVNYSYQDRLWRLELQTLLDYINAFLGLVVLQYLLKLRTDSEHLKALLWITYFIVCMFGIILPFLFGTLYLLSRVGIPTKNFSDKWVTTPAAIISLVISWLSYKQKEKPKSESSH